MQRSARKLDTTASSMPSPKPNPSSHQIPTPSQSCHTSMLCLKVKGSEYMPDQWKRLWRCFSAKVQFGIWRNPDKFSQLKHWSPFSLISSNLSFGAMNENCGRHQ